MRALRFDVLLEDQHGFRADAVLGDAIFEVLIEPRDLRRLRASLLDMARFSAGKPERRGILVLADPSMRPRSPEALLQRLRELKRSAIAVGGVLGARHYLSGLDLVGTPRLDLVVHNPRPEGSHEFLRKLDPALQPAKRGEPARVFVHTLCRPVAFFQKGDDGMVWADEVECLLDLHEARLESQALEFLERLKPQVNP